MKQCNSKEYASDEILHTGRVEGREGSMYILDLVYVTIFNISYDPKICSVFNTCSSLCIHTI